MLAGHEQSNHHVGDLVVRDGGAVLVHRCHEMLHNVEFIVFVAEGLSFLNGIHVDLGNGTLSVVTLAVPGERGPVQHKVDGGEAHVEVVVQVGQSLVKLVADKSALKSVGSSEDCNLGHSLGNVDGSRLALEGSGALEVGGNLVGDDGNVGSERFGGKSNFHELEDMLVSDQFAEHVMQIASRGA